MSKEIAADEVVAAVEALLSRPEAKMVVLAAPQLKPLFDRLQAALKVYHKS